MNVGLLVGINDYPGNELRGCLNDVAAMRDMLCSIGWSPMHIKAIKDQQATKAKILHSLKQMVEQAQDGDHLVFHYSGHGSQVPDTNGDEPDSLDECLCPYDWPEAITDDELRNIILRLHGGATIDVILDCCHSGTGLRDGSGVPRCLPYSGPMPIATGWHPQHILKGLDQPNVCLWAGCKSTQTSADAYIGNKYQGAMTWAMCKTLGHFNKDRHHIHLNLGYELQYAGYEQEPQIECDTAMRIREIFT